MVYLKPTNSAANFDGTLDSNTASVILWHNSSSLHSLDLLNELMDQSNDEASPSESEDVPASTPGRFPEQLPGVQSRRASSRVKTFSPSLAWALPGNAPKVAKRVRRARNAHTGSRGGHHHNHHPHHGQLMRVGCVLGTCQVQNLSHRLYQLIGQSGREDSSPINPRSPHSFGWVGRQLWPNPATSPQLKNLLSWQVLLVASALGLV